ncbi:fimbrial protein [Salmonella enterica]|nr:fimbrial protein [Salmonella enterica]EDS1445466.1 fimbrial protein [Salmonella enterica subsp. enterica serovar Enteritidis]EHC7607333.1 fimbrial protein [Salmonella enterica]EHC7690511.1 fimbrial protein [Salmonella enterica]EIM8174751.1 fimbrial protein [Salmonella enterica]
MKKTLIALAVAASAAVSGSAMAWTTGEFNDSFDINGTISVESFNDKWEWMVGNGLSFKNNKKEMTENNTKLTITQNNPTAILLGRTKEAFAAESVGVGAIPLISFSDYEGHEVSLQSLGGNKGYLEFPMKDDAANKLGKVKVDVTFSGLLSKSNQTSGYVELYPLASSTNSDVYNGGLPWNSPLSSATTVSSIISKFSGDNHTALLAQIQKVLPDAGWRGQREQWVLSTDMVDTNGEVMASSYALGIDQGQTIEATFTDPVVKTTQWSAPLNVAVTYN